MKLIGGFFGLEVPSAVEDSLADLWQMPREPSRTYANGRSALAALLSSLEARKLWLPAYICSSVVEAAKAAGMQVAYYPLGDDLQPDVAFLSAARASEIVLAVDYFGAAPGEEFLSFVKQNGDLRFIEDAAQAMDTGRPQWGTWRLHTPRKLVGAPDGGFIIPANDLKEPHLSQGSAALEKHSAARLRYEDPANNALWHGINQAREADETVSRQPMSQLSHALLQGLSAKIIATKRRDNFHALSVELAQWAFLPSAPLDFVPFGFPIRLKPQERAAVRSALIAEGIFPAIHWTDLPSPASFETAHGFSRELLTLPCDHRYDASDMRRVAGIVIHTLRAQ